MHKNRWLLLSFGVVLTLFVLFLYLGGKSVQPEVEPGVISANFEESMGGKGYWELDLLLSREDNRAKFKEVEALYYSNLPTLIERKKTPTIPKVIHQIWLGPRQPPAFFDEYKNSWEKKHPGWEYRLWKDADAAVLDMDLQQEYDSSTNWGEKSDILRAEILDRYGGLYVDIDFECIKPFDELQEKYDFFAGLEPPHQGLHPKTFPQLSVSNALVGVCPHHPIIKEWKEKIRNGWVAIGQRLPESKERVLERTFYTFGDTVLEKAASSQYVNIVLPSTYFYPFTFAELTGGRKKKRTSMRGRIHNLLCWIGLRKNPPFSMIKRETMAVHYWGGTWQKSLDELFRDMHEHMVQLESSLREEIAGLRNEVSLAKRGNELYKPPTHSQKEMSELNQ